MGRPPPPKWGRRARYASAVCEVPTERRSRAVVSNFADTRRGLVIKPERTGRAMIRGAMRHSRHLRAQRMHALETERVSPAHEPAIMPSAGALAARPKRDNISECLQALEASMNDLSSLSPTFYLRAPRAERRDAPVRVPSSRNPRAAPTGPRALNRGWFMRTRPARRLQWCARPAGRLVPSRPSCRQARLARRPPRVRRPILSARSEARLATRWPAQDEATSGP